MYSELIVKGYLTPDIRSRVIDSDFGGTSICDPPNSDGSGCADGSGVCGWGDISVVESAGASGRSKAPGDIEEASSVAVVAVVGLPDFSSVLDAIVSGVLELASPPRDVDISGASFTAAVEMSLEMVAAAAIFITVCVPFRQEDEKCYMMHTHVNVNAARQEA